MISLTSAQLSAWLAALILPLARMLAFVASSPIFGNRQLPARIKLGFALALTVVIAPTVAIPPGLDVASAPGLLALVQQIAVGLMMGFTLRLVFSAVEMAGDMAGLQMGLGFATFYDPVNASHTPVLAQFLGIVTALAFLALDLHLAMLAALVESFQSFPVSTAPPSALGFRTLAAWGGSLFAFGLQFALPLIGVLLIVNLALGILTRSAPQLNIFAVGFPITLAVGFIALALTLPLLAPLLEFFTRQALDSMGTMLLQLRPAP